MEALLSLGFDDLSNSLFFPQFSMRSNKEFEYGDTLHRVLDWKTTLHFQPVELTKVITWWWYSFASICRQNQCIFSLRSLHVSNRISIKELFWISVMTNTHHQNCRTCGPYYHPELLLLQRELFIFWVVKEVLHNCFHFHWVTEVKCSEPSSI